MHRNLPTRSGITLTTEQQVIRCCFSLRLINADEIDTITMGATKQWHCGIAKA